MALERVITQNLLFVALLSLKFNQLFNYHVIIQKSRGYTQIKTNLTKKLAFICFFINVMSFYKTYSLQYNARNDKKRGKNYLLWMNLQNR